MPAVIPIIAGAASMAGGVAIGTATTLATISAGAMIVGGALTIAGGITGNKTLAKVGGFMSLAGGVGGIANSLINTASTAASTAASATPNFAADSGVTADLTNSTSLAGGSLAGSQAATTGVDFAAQSGVGADLASATSLNPASSLELATAAPTGVAQAAGVALPTLSAPTLNAASAVAGGGTSQGVLARLNTSLGKYDNIMKAGSGLTQVLGGVAQGYEQEQNRKATAKIYQDRIDLQNKKFNTANANANADFKLNLGYVPNNGGILYKGMPRQPLPIRTPVRTVQP